MRTLRSWALGVIVCLAVMASMAALAGSVAWAADLGPSKERVRHVSSERRASTAYECRVGWWRTIDWGKVRPRYAGRCYRFARY
jgi:hypothetical protein